MRLISIKAKNFRQYRDIEINFPKTNTCDIHIIEASNGVGKTNLLNAINWCLYGDEPHKSGIFQRDDIHDINDDSNSLPLYNIEVMQQLEDEGTPLCSVEVVVKLDIDGEIYSFSRVKDFRVGTGVQFGQEKKSCKKKNLHGSTEFLEDDAIYTTLESVLPRNIREYFYFDGEQLLTYFKDNKRRNVKENVYTIAQINILDEVKKHLKSIKDYYKNEFNKNDPELKLKEERWINAQQNFEKIKEKLENTKAELKKAEKTIEEINIAINGKEFISAYNEAYNAKKKLLESYENDLLRLNAERDKFIREYLIKILLYNNNKSVMEYIDNRKAENEDFTDLRELDIEQSIDTGECKLCRTKLDKNKKQILKYLLDTIKGNSSMQKIANISPYVRESLKIGNFLDEKDRILSAIESKTEELNETSKEVDKLDVQLKAFGANAVEDIAQLLQKRNDFNDLLNKKQIDKAKFTAQYDDAKKEAEQLQEEYNKALKTAAEQENTKKYWEFSCKAYDVLNDVINDLAENSRNLIASRTEELFGELIWKKDTYGKVELSEDYSLKLYHKYNNKSCLDSCSASETELLALAFTLAVHEVSGYNSFLLIDTPVGRVSDANRKNFAEVLLNISTDKQIILEVTPSEYSNEIKEVLSNPKLSSYVKLYLKNNCVYKEN